MGEFKVIIVGGYPPPYGGTAIHNMRLFDYCLAADADCILIDPYGNRENRSVPSRVCELNGNPIRRLFDFRKRVRSFGPAVVHFQVSALERFSQAGHPLLNIVGKRPSVLTIQSGSFPEYYRQSASWRRACIRSVLLRFTKVIATNDAHRRFLVDVVGLPTDRVTQLSLFLPPNALPAEECCSELDQIATLRDKVDVVLVSSGYLTHIYGYKEIIQAKEILGRRGHKVGIVLAFYSVYDEQYQTSLMQAIGDDSNVIIFRDLSPEKFATVFQRCDLYVRATINDGDSVAVREAGYWRKPVIASDAVPRPKGAELFGVGDATQLADAIERNIKSREIGLLQEEFQHAGDSYLALYRELHSRFCQ